MPAVTAATIFSEARGTYLNDVAATTFSDAVLLPFLKTAYEHLRNELALNDIPTLNAKTAAQTIAINGLVLTSVPTDLLVPISIMERTPGSTELYVPMLQRTWEPQETQSSTLRYWTWRQEAIAFLGSTAAREIIVEYLSDLNPAAIVVGSTLLASNGRSYLAARVAALAAMFIWNNDTIAIAANKVADDQLGKTIKIAIKERQGLPTRRKPFLGPRRLGY